MQCCTQVNVAMVLKTLKENGEKATKLIRRAVALMAQEEWSSTMDELAVSLMSNESYMYMGIIEI